MSLSIDISERLEDSCLLELLSDVSAVAEHQEVPFFIVGATARDLVLWYGFGIRTGRATADVDIGVRVASWEQDAQLRQAMLDSGHFERVGDKQRMRHRSLSLLDLLPFGDITGPNQRIAWPADGDTKLNLLGFEEAYEHAIPVTVASEPKLVVQVASVAGLVLMKIFAWDDRRPENRDAMDLGVLISSYMKTGNGNRLFDEHADLLQDDEFDYQLAGAHILGRDLARICENETRERVLHIIERSLKRGGELPLVVRSAGESPQVVRSEEFWVAIRDELAS